MAKFRKKPVVVEATQWFKNGDHPLDNSCLISPENLSLSEGELVRYYRRPDDDGKRECEKCGKTMHEHGWIDTLEGGHVVCPGDWIITGVMNEKYPRKPDIFEATYEPVLEDTEESTGITNNEEKEQPVDLAAKAQGLVNDIIDLEDRVQELLKLTNHTYCAFCGERFYADGAVATDAIREHIEICKAHPMRALEEQIDKLAKKILSYDCGLPAANEEYPEGMGAVEAAIVYMDQLRQATKKTISTTIGCPKGTLFGGDCCGCITGEYDKEVQAYIFRCNECGEEVGSGGFE